MNRDDIYDPPGITIRGHEYIPYEGMVEGLDDLEAFPDTEFNQAQKRDHDKIKRRHIIAIILTVIVVATIPFSSLILNKMSSAVVQVGFAGTTDPNPNGPPINNPINLTQINPTAYPDGVYLTQFNATFEYRMVSCLFLKQETIDFLTGNDTRILFFWIQFALFCGAFGGLGEVVPVPTEYYINETGYDEQMPFQTFRFNPPGADLIGLSDPRFPANVYYAVGFAAIAVSFEYESEDKEEILLFNWGVDSLFAGEPLPASTLMINGVNRIEFSQKVNWNDDGVVDNFAGTVDVDVIHTPPILALGTMLNPSI